MKIYTYHYEHLVMHIIVKSLCCTPETNVTLYSNFNEKVKVVEISYVSFKEFC